METSDNYTVPELKAKAKAKGLKGYSKMNKEELCNLLNIKYIKKTQSSKQSPKKSSPVKSVSKSIPNCNPINLIYPCKVKRGIFRDEEDWQAYLRLKKRTHHNTQIPREIIIKLANRDLQKQRELLKHKKTPTKKVKFAV